MDDEIIDQENIEETPEVEETLEAEGISETEEGMVELHIASGKDVGLPEHRELSQEEMEYYKGLAEAILFLSQEPLGVTTVAKRCDLDRINARIIVDTLVDDYAERDGGILLREIAGGYQFITSDRYSSTIKKIVKDQKKDKLSRSALETLAIISYRQPITLPEIEDIRGANSRAIVLQLVARRLIKPQGYRPVPGRPTLYVTTRQFLMQFAMNSLSDLPPLEDVKELKFDDLE
jgi:segregation and condensation protein B